MGKPRDIEYMEEIKSISANRMVELREVFGVTQKGMAERLNICRQAIYYYESGRSLISVEVLCKIHDVFHVSPEWVLGMVNTDKSIERRKKVNY